MSAVRRCSRAAGASSLGPRERTDLGSTARLPPLASASRPRSASRRPLHHPLDALPPPRHRARPHARDPATRPCPGVFRPALSDRARAVDTRPPHVASATPKMVRCVALVCGRSSVRGRGGTSFCRRGRWATRRRRDGRGRAAFSRFFASLQLLQHALANLPDCASRARLARVGQARHRLFDSRRRRRLSLRFDRPGGARLQVALHCHGPVPAECHAQRDEPAGRAQGDPHRRRQRDDGRRQRVDDP